MKYYTRYTTVVLLLLLATSPILAEAQTSGTSSNATSSSWWPYQDGASDFGNTRRQRIRQYREQSDGLSQKIAALPSIANPFVYMPVLFGVSIKDISPNFGDPRSGGRTHEGEDIMAVKGTPIVSPTPAVVLRTGAGGTEGNYVYTANPGGETFVYMHLDRVGEGVASGIVLTQGSLIGYVGNTGNASGGPAHLHFEIHNSSGIPVNPFPRLTSEVSLQEKITDLSKILTQTADPTTLSQFMVTNFRSTFAAALAANIILPIPITNALGTIAASVVPITPVNVARTIPAGDLDVGSSGALVVSLQKYLIQAASGPAAIRLKSAGATGNFGSITKAALAEYQARVGISPSNGYYSSGTRLYITDHPLSTSLSTASSTSESLPGNSASQSNAVVLTRNLYQGKSGDDVRALQIWLNASGYKVASSGPGSSGNETSYFGKATTAAVIKFQIARSISPAAGYVGQLTRAALGSL